MSSCILPINLKTNISHIKEKQWTLTDIKFKTTYKLPYKFKSQGDNHSEVINTDPVSVIMIHSDITIAFVNNFAW